MKLMRMELNNKLYQYRNIKICKKCTFMHKIDLTNHLLKNTKAKRVKVHLDTQSCSEAKLAGKGSLTDVLL